MTVFHLKLIAIFTMLIDHIGLFFFPEIPMFRIIGRLSFPLFAFLIANGARYTHSRNHYAVRLFLFALISQIPYLLLYRLFVPTFWGLNIFFTLFLGLLAIMVFEKMTAKFMQVVVCLLFAVVAVALDASYQAFGVLSILVFYVFSQRFALMAFFQIVLFFAFYPIPLLYGAYVLGQTAEYSNIIALSQPVGLFSLVFIWLYNKKKGPSLKYLFYLFYPVHLFVLYLIARFVR